MRSSTIASTTFLAASLLVKDVLAGPPHQLRHKHRRDVVTDVVVDQVIETVWSTIFVTGDEPATEAPPAPAPTTVETTPAVVVAVTPSSVAPVETPSTTSTTPVPTTSTTAVAQVAAEVATSAAAVPTTLATVVTAATSTATSSSGKRGLAYNSADLLSGFSGYSEITWAYNWASSSGGLDLSGVEYVPLLWGLADEFTSVWATAAQSAIDSGSQYLMSFNEPDLSSQSNIGYADAAANWITYMEPFADKAKLLSPAVTNGGSPMGLTYLENFLSACSTCTIHATNIHWYDSATNIDYFKTYVAEAYTAGGNRPIWLSEFGASGSDDEINTFLETVLPWLDEQDYVEKYAYFMASDGVLLSSGTTLSTIGTTYASTT